MGYDPGRWHEWQGMLLCPRCSDDATLFSADDQTDFDPITPAAKQWCTMCLERARTRKRGKK